MGTLGQEIGAVDLIELKRPHQPETGGIDFQVDLFRRDIDLPLKTDFLFRVGFWGDLEQGHAGGHCGRGGDGGGTGDSGGGGARLGGASGDGWGIGFSRGPGNRGAERDRAGKG